MSGRSVDTFALSYHDKEGGTGWHYIPTVPVARKWRGPFPTEQAMKTTLVEELGRGVTITQTKCPPCHLNGAKR